MKKVFLTVFVLTLVVALALPVAGSVSAERATTGGEAARSQVEGETITVGTNAEYPPFESVDENGELVGFDIALMNAIAEDAGFEIEWVNTRWEGIFVALSEGEFDAVISAATITEEREEIVDFSTPYFNAGQVIAVSVDNAETISEPEDLAGLRIGVQTGTTGDEYATAIEGAEVSRFDEVTLAFQALGQGDVDAVIADGPTAVDIIANNPDLNLTVVGESLTDEFYGIAVRPDFPELLEAINTSLANLIEDGTYAEIYTAAFGTEVPEGFLDQPIVYDPTDPASVIEAYLLSGFNGDLETVIALTCEEDLTEEDMVTEEDIEALAGLKFDLSGVEYATEVDGDVATVTLSGVISIDDGTTVTEVPVEELFDPTDPPRLILVEEAWLVCDLDPEG